MAQLYQKIIMEHYRQPLNRGRLKKADQTFRGVNYFCGDQISFDVQLDQQKKVKAVGWVGSGCAISQASASVFSELIKGKKMSAIKKISSQQFLNRLDIVLSPTRMKCALLPLYTLKEETR